MSEWPTIHEFLTVGKIPEEKVLLLAEELRALLMVYRDLVIGITELKAQVIQITEAKGD